MDIVIWSDKYLLGIDEIDNQHKGLVIIINELFNLMSQGKAKAHMNQIFDHLTDYTKKHFFVEEKMLIKFAYPDYEQHKIEHKKFIEKLDKYKKEFESGKVTISLEILNFLKEWLLNHIQISDKKYALHIKKFSIE